MLRTKDASREISMANILSRSKRNCVGATAGDKLHPYRRKVMPSRYRNTPGSWLYLLVAMIACFQCTTPAIAASSMVLQPCQLPELSRPARCGVLELPENPDRPQGQRLAISVAVVPA